MKPEDKAVVQQAQLMFSTMTVADDIDWVRSVAELQANALRELLEQPEPVFCEYCGGNDDADFGLPTDHCTDCDRPDPAPPESVQEPDAVVTGYHGGQCVITPTDPARVFNTGTAFYTQPTDLNLNCKSVQARLATQWGYVKAEPAVPLTTYQICEMGLVHGMSNLERFYYEQGVLDAEAAHGITAAPEKGTP
jgi:hypothetical protein